MASGFQRLGVALAVVATAMVAAVGCGGTPGPTPAALIVPAGSTITMDQTVDLTVTVTGFTPGYPVQLSWCVAKTLPAFPCCWCATDAIAPCDLTLDVCTNGYLRGPLDRHTVTFVPPRRAGTYGVEVVANVWGTSEAATTVAAVTVTNPAP